MLYFLISKKNLFVHKVWKRDYTINKSLRGIGQYINILWGTTYVIWLIKNPQEKQIEYSKQTALHMGKGQRSEILLRNNITI